MDSAEIREELVEVLKLDLIGPEPGHSRENEVLDRAPSREYLTGFLIPFEPPSGQAKQEVASDGTSRSRSISSATRRQFVASDILQWQSQNRTTQRSAVGQAIKHHRERGVEVHLFVRQHPKSGGRAAPFVYCGQLEFLDWKGEKPITVRWRLLSPFSQRPQGAVSGFMS